jgi:hypothetical protein
VIYPGSTPVGNATLVVANVLRCNKHSLKKMKQSHYSHKHPKLHLHMLMT